MFLVVKKRQILKYINSIQLINVKDIFSLLHAINFVLTSDIPEAHWKVGGKCFTSFKNPTLLCCGDGIRKNKTKQKQMQLEITERESVHTVIAQRLNNLLNLL